LNQRAIVVGSATPPWILRQQALLKQEQEEAQEFYKKLYGQASNPASDTMQNEQTFSPEQNTPTDSHSDKNMNKSKFYVSYFLLYFYAPLGLPFNDTCPPPNK